MRLHGEWKHSSEYKRIEYLLIRPVMRTVFESAMSLGRSLRLLEQEGRNSSLDGEERHCIYAFLAGSTARHPIREPTCQIRKVYDGDFPQRE